MKKNKGITLIALIITIIILLILVGISVNLLIKGDLFGSAEKAVNGTNAKVEEQQTRVDELMGELNQVEAKNAVHDWQYTDETRGKIRCTCLRCKLFPDGDTTGRTLSIGQQIGKTEYKTGKTSISSEKSNHEEQSLVLDKEETKWVVFGYEDKNKDGANELLLLTTEHPTKERLYFSGTVEDITAVNEVNRMCRELYGSNARGMTIEDVQRALGYIPEGGIYEKNVENYVSIGNFTTKIKDLGETWTSIKEATIDYHDGVFWDPNNPNGIKDNGNALGEYEVNGYFFGIDAYIPEGIPSISNHLANNSKNMIFGNNENNYGYWLATCGVQVSQYSVFFSLGNVYHGRVSSCCYMYSSRGIDFGLRPIVFLNGEIPEAGEILEFTGYYGMTIC